MYLYLGSFNGAIWAFIILNELFCESLDTIFMKNIKKNYQTVNCLFSFLIKTFLKIVY